MVTSLIGKWYLFELVTRCTEGVGNTEFFRINEALSATKVVTNDSTLYAVNNLILLSMCVEEVPIA